MIYSVALVIFRTRCDTPMAFWMLPLFCHYILVQVEIPKNYLNGVWLVQVALVVFEHMLRHLMAFEFVTSANPLEVVDWFLLQADAGILDNLSYFSVDDKLQEHVAWIGQWVDVGAFGKPSHTKGDMANWCCSTKLFRRHCKVPAASWIPLCRCVQLTRRQLREMCCRRRSRNRSENRLQNL